MDSSIAELELSLERGEGDGFTAGARVVRPDVEGDDRLAEPVEFVLDRAALIEKVFDPVEYGRVLTRCLFADPRLRDAFTTARASAPRLRIRLSIGASAPELHDILWETLADPQQLERPLLNDARILFSRYLSSFDWRPVRLHPKQQLRALVVVANPVNLGNFQLAPIDVARELEHARVGLRDAEGGEIPITVVCSDPQATAGRALLDRMLDALREDHDILYLVCHGKLDRGGRANLYLEGEGGTVAVVSGAQLAHKLAELEERPRLVVLASCQSAGSSTEPAAPDARALVALGPRLAEAGIPAVVAMSGNVPVQTVAQFMPAFFRTLAENGLVDHAMAVGRSAVSRPADASRPVLFMRLRRGRIWYDAGFAGQGTLRSWAGLRKRLEQGRSTPLLGFGVLESLFEYRSWLARTWARQHGFPLAPSQREDLAQVAQFLADNNYSTFPHEQLVEDFARGIVERLGSAPIEGGVDAMLKARLARRAGGRADPYRILAELPLPVYLTFCPDSLLLEALAASRVAPQPGAAPVPRRPRRGVLVWKPQLKSMDLPDPWREDEDYVPSVEEPLVYHVFGTFDVPHSLVLTLDDYFDFLLNFQKPEVHQGIPGVVRKQLVNTSLLFLGFPLDSWEFRAVFRMILQQQGATASDGAGSPGLSSFLAGLSSANKPHVAAQVEPEEGRVLDPVAAHDFLHHTFNQAQVDVYFGTVERFLMDLEQQLRRNHVP